MIDFASGEAWLVPCSEIAARYADQICNNPDEDTWSAAYRFALSSPYQMRRTVRELPWSEMAECAEKIEEREEGWSEGNLVWPESAKLSFVNHV